MRTGRPRETPEHIYRVTVARRSDSEVRFFSSVTGLQRFIQRRGKENIRVIKRYQLEGDVKIG